MRGFVVGSAMALALLAAPDGAGAGEAPGAFAFSFTAIEGGPLPLAQWQGRPVLVVNTASMCGFTRQYDGLQALWERYRERGLVVLAVPSADFGGQEYDDNAKIKTFCEVNFAVDFPMTERVAVKGADAHPLFAWMRRQAGDAAGPHWNFWKYLIAPDGSLAGYWPSQTEPDAAPLTAAIEASLGGES